MGLTEWNRNFAGEFNISGKEPSGLGLDLDEREVTLLKKLFTKEAAMKLYAHLKEDYDTFHLPLPSWVNSATGEYYDRPCVEELVRHDSPPAIVAECAAANQAAGLAPITKGAAHRVSIHRQ